MHKLIINDEVESPFRDEGVCDVDTTGAKKVRGICVVVLGMHRSGTSAVAGSLSRIGVFFGDKLLPPAPYNPKGFYEHLDILSTDEEILHALDSSFQDIKPLPALWHKSVSILPLKERLREIMERDFACKHIFGFKDPRVSILLPLYLDIFKEMDLDVRFIVCERSTAEIALSLNERIGYSLHQSIELCQKYKDSIEEGIVGQIYTRIQMNDFIASPEITLKRVVSELKLPIHFTEDTSNQIKDFIDTSLKHHTVSTEEVLLKTLDEVNALKSTLDEVTHTSSVNMQKFEEYIVVLQNEKQLLQNEKQLLQTDKNNLEQHTRSLQAQYDAVLHEYETSKIELVQVHEKRKRLEEELVKIKEELIENEEDKKSLEGHFLQLQRSFDERVEQVSHLEEQTHRLHNTLAHRDHRIQFLEQEAIRFVDIDTTEHHKVQAEINHLRETIDMIQRSLSWKIVYSIQHTLDRIIPPRSIIRRPYIKILKILQDKTQKNKKTELSESSNKIHADAPLSVVEPDILFVNHEESRTGAPRIIFEIAKSALSKYSIAVVSKVKGGMTEEFKKTFGDRLFYPYDLLEERERHEMARIMLEKIKPKLVYVNSIVSYEYACEAKKLGIPVIMHIHEMANAYDVAISAESHADFATFADVFIVVSEATKRDLITIMHVPEEKTRLIHEFVDSKSIIRLSGHQPRKVVEEMLGIDPEDLLIVSMGTFDKRKGGDYFIKIAKRFTHINSQHKQKIKMLWIGRRPRQHDLFSVMFQENRGAFLHIDEIQNPFPFLARADIFFMSSREDPFPLVVLEAMALQKPVVAFAKAGGAAEAGEGSISLIENFNVDEAYKTLYKLVMDKEDQKRRGTIAKERQKKYEKDAILVKVHKEIDDLIPKNT